jgi:hypothetical protein
MISNQSFIDGSDSPAMICRVLNLEVGPVGNKAVYLTPGRTVGQPTMVLLMYKSWQKSIDRNKD